MIGTYFPPIRPVYVDDYDEDDTDEQFDSYLTAHEQETAA